MHRALLEGESAHEHGFGLEQHPGQQNGIIDPVMLAETLAPEEQRIDGADAVSDHGQQKEMSVSPPRHAYNVNPPRRVRKEEFGSGATLHGRRVRKGRDASPRRPARYEPNAVGPSGRPRTPRRGVPTSNYRYVRD